jgi:hypothetical protein
LVVAVHQHGRELVTGAPGLTQSVK